MATAGKAGAGSPTWIRNAEAERLAGEKGLGKQALRRARLDGRIAWRKDGLVYLHRADFLHWLESPGFTGEGVEADQEEMVI